jgi:hypothetical protein
MIFSNPVTCCIDYIQFIFSKTRCSFEHKRKLHVGPKRYLQQEQNVFFILLNMHIIALTQGIGFRLFLNVVFHIYSVCISF